MVKITLIGISLLIMIVLTLFSVMTGNSFIGNILSVEYSGIASIDDVPSYFEIEPTAEGFYIDPLTGAITILIIIIALAGALGLKILGSGLSDTAHRTSMIALIYTGLWSLLSALAWGLMFSIEYVGAVLYVTLTIFYAIGVIKKISEG